ncbi:UNVERIFIED_CONTAM: Pentatricopeptide repeat-containing protein, chloroplastic [Sesamum angustifolium]|uniref:Pentatricopeptide repeat-containing protein, chloroplastic n=1 Tax=Sesamum angustifolium TaxID=2727405 RepID=A0AAW2MHN9_9LAMI
MTTAVAVSRHLHQPLSHLLSGSLQVIPAIKSVLQSLNPQNPRTHQSPNPSILNQFSTCLTPNLVVQVINDLTNPYHSLFFFTWASSPSPNSNLYRHSHFCYIAITDKLLSHKLFSLAADLLKTHNKFSDFMVGKFIKAHGDLGHLKWAVKLFHQVRRGEVGDCLFSYNALLGVLVKANRVSDAWAYFGRIVIKESVVKPDVSTYTTMIRGLYGYCKKGEFGNAMRCFDEMVSGGNCEPNVLTYNALINGLCLNGDVDEARRMMSRMRLSGLRDNIATHTSLLKGYCIAGRSDEAIKHFKEMLNLGMNLDGKSYAVIVNEYCKLGRPDEAVVLLREMREEALIQV